MKRLLLIIVVAFPVSSFAALPAVVQCLQRQEEQVPAATATFAASFTGTCLASDGVTTQACVLPTVGNTIITTVDYNSSMGLNALGTQTNNQGNTVNQDVTLTASLTGQTTARIFSEHVTTSSGTYTITQNFPVPGTEVDIIAWQSCEVSGLATSASDQHSSNSGLAASLTVTDSSPNTNNGIVFTIVDTNVAVSTPPSGYTKFTKPVPALIYDQSYYKVTASIETSSATFTYGSTATSLAVLATYKAPALPTNSQLMLLGIGK